MGGAAYRTGNGDSRIGSSKSRIRDECGYLFVFKFSAVQLFPALGGKKQIQGGVVQINAVYKRQSHKLLVQCAAGEDRNHGIVFLHI